jgi:hypothetical protein
MEIVEKLALLVLKPSLKRSTMAWEKMGMSLIYSGN